MSPDTLERPEMTSATPAQTGASPYQEVKEATTQQVRQAAADLKETGTESLRSAKAAGHDFLYEQKEKFAAKIDNYTEAVRAACENLAEGSENPLATPAHRMTQQMSKASDYIRSHDAMDVLHDLGDLARRRPEIVFGGLFVAGLASARFLKASSRGSQSKGYDYPRPSYASAYQPRPTPSACSGTETL